MRIDYLANFKKHIPKIAGWHHAQWGHFHPERQSFAWEKVLHKRANRDQIPITLIALLNDDVVGSASLVENDLSTHSHLAPWLTDVFVENTIRNQGIGSALVKRIEIEALYLGFKKIYLLTPDKQSLYSKLGWFKKEEILYMGQKETLMTKKLLTMPEYL